MKSLSTPHIKRPTNSFMLWAQINRKIVSSENPKLSNAKISTLLGQQWKTLSNEEKKSYEDKAKQVKQKHKIQYPNYKYSPQIKIGRIKTIKTIKLKSCKRKTTSKNKPNTFLNENYFQLTININNPKPKYSLNKQETKNTALLNTINSEMKLNINFNNNWITYNEGYDYYEEIELFYYKL